MSITVAHFEIIEHTKNGTARLGLTGELDLTAAPQLRDRLTRLAADRLAVSLDLSRVDFIDSIGVQVLVHAIKEAQRNGSRLQIGRETTSQVRRLLTLVNLQELVLGYESDQRADLPQRPRARYSPPRTTRRRGHSAGTTAG
jgi:anti-anti-sigma factor